MIVEHRQPTIDQLDHLGDIVRRTYGRRQIELSETGMGSVDTVAAIRINGRLFVAAPDGDEILDHEWKTGKIYGS